MSDAVRDRTPPPAVARLLNPLMKRLLTSPVGRRMNGLALLEFDGRRSSRRYKVVCGWHETGSGALVFSPARWRQNFAGGAPATVRHLGKRHTYRGLLETDPTTVAAAIAVILASGTAPRALGLHVPDDHLVDAADVQAVDRAMISFSDEPPTI